MIIRATQKKMMSKPVTSTDDGRNVRELARVRRASRASRWHTAPTRTTCRARRRRGATSPARGRARASPARARRPRCARRRCCRPRRTTPGIWWPHQSWREMHQSWMLLIQCRYVVIQLLGTNRTRPASPVADRRCRVADRVEAQLLDRLARPQRMRRRRGRAHRDEPLVGQHRLDDLAGASAARHDHPVRLLRLDEQPARLRDRRAPPCARRSGRGRDISPARCR